MIAVVLGIALLAFVLPAEAATYYVATTGSDSNSCAQAQSISNPKLTIAGGIGCTTGANSDVVDVRVGTYTERVMSWPTGTSYGNAMTLRAHAGETVIIQNTVEVLTFNSTSHAYVIVDGNRSNNGSLIIDAMSTAEFALGMTDGAHHIRFQGVECRHAAKSCALVTYGSMTTPGNTFHEWLGPGCSFHDNGSVTNQDHGIYVATSSNLIDGCAAYNNAAYGFHIFASAQEVSNNTVRNSITYNNSQNSASSAGILIGSGDGNAAYNNVVYGNVHGIDVDNGSTNGIVDNNTIYANSPGCAIKLGTNSTATNTSIRNNIFWSNGADQICDNGGGSATVTATNLTVDPGFIDAAVDDFHLQSGSAARDAGTTLASVTTDKDGISRPQGVAYDIGAYEFAAASDQTFGFRQRLPQ